MVNARKRVIAALSSSDMTDDALVETALDHVRAIAFADPLGVALWRLLYLRQTDAFAVVVRLLVRKMRRKHEPLRLITQVCQLAVLELVDERCHACGGRGVRADAVGVRRSCAACNGTGMRPPSSLARCQRLGLPAHAYARIERRFARARELLANADTQARIDVDQQLGRGTSRNEKTVLRCPS